MNKLQQTMTIHKRLLGAVLFISLLLNVSAWAAENPALVDLNQFSLKLYRQALQQQQQALEPMILVQLSSMSLYHDGKVDTINLTPNTYTVQKTFAHIPLAIFAISQTYKADQQLDELKQLRADMIKLQAQLSSIDMTAEQARRARHMINTTLPFLEDSIRQGNLDPQTTSSYYNDLQADLDQCIYDAAKARINAMQAGVDKWRTQLKPTAWDNITVVVAGHKAARTDNLEMQFFTQLLNLEPDSERLLFSESVFNSDEMIAMLAKHHLATKFGEAIFSDPERMHRDVFADATSQILSEQTLGY